MVYQHIEIPKKGEKIRVKSDLSLDVPSHPIIPFIEGDGIGVDITPVMRKVVDSAVIKPMVMSEKLPGWKFMLEKKRTKLYGNRCLVT